MPLFPEKELGIKTKLCTMMMVCAVIVGILAVVLSGPHSGTIRAGYVYLLAGRFCVV
jgi:hypothetical protein